MSVNREVHLSLSSLLGMLMKQGDYIPIESLVYGKKSVCTVSIEEALNLKYIFIKCFLVQTGELFLCSAIAYA